MFSGATIFNRDIIWAACFVQPRTSTHMYVGVRDMMSPQEDGPATGVQLGTLFNMGLELKGTSATQHRWWTTYILWRMIELWNILKEGWGTQWRWVYPMEDDGVVEHPETGWCTQSVGSMIQVAKLGNEWSQSVWMKNSRTRTSGNTWPRSRRWFTVVDLMTNVSMWACSHKHIVQGDRVNPTVIHGWRHLDVVQTASRAINKVGRG